jgi:glycosyltransferase involved in cell wall biosynthesis
MIRAGLEYASGPNEGARANTVNTHVNWSPCIAVMVPCLNEEVSIPRVVADFRRALPEALIFVYDNGSTDRTMAAARAAGAIVRTEPLKGKGNVVRRMFADIEADIYVLVDGDDTYDAASAPALVGKLADESLDVVTGARAEESQAAYRRGHRFGNRVLTELVARFFGARVTDLLSGYRVMSRRFVKSFPSLASGFEIETELTVHALQLRLPIAEIVTPYRERPPASSSKLRAIPDGIRILHLIARLIREERPLEFFSAMAGLFALSSIALAAPVIGEYFSTGLVPRLPTAVLALGLMLVAFLSLTCGLILATVTRGRMEAKRLHYLSSPIRMPRPE